MVPVHIVIVGCGRVGSGLGLELAGKGHSVAIIDRNAKAFRRLPDDWNGQTIVGSGFDRDDLDAARAHTAGALAAVTSGDNSNILTARIARETYAIPHVVARVNHPKTQWLFTETWGVDVSVSTPQLLTALVEEAVSVGSLVRLLRFEGGNAHLVEVTLADDSPADGVSVADLGVPRDATIVAVVRADHLIVPRGDTRLAAGDEVLVLITADAEDEVQRLLVGP